MTSWCELNNRKSGSGRICPCAASALPLVTQSTIPGKEVFKCNSLEETLRVRPSFRATIVQAEPLADQETVNCVDDSTPSSDMRPRHVRSEQSSRLASATSADSRAARLIIELSPSVYGDPQEAQRGQSEQRATPEAVATLLSHLSGAWTVLSARDLSKHRTHDMKPQIYYVVVTLNPTATNPS
ncbi:hypothetical protein RRG08_042804 [Elysia crispata]|uniref:Uncharacterized protein n=1 Tax=Elysia crispata TaxID=231223 RepID=A0AAE1CW64_9GAST|nr:hypothetical protein RRG08_042804 [Elysia crispata]